MKYFTRIKHILPYLEVKDKLRRGEKITKKDVAVVFRAAEESMSVLVEKDEDTIH